MTPTGIKDTLERAANLLAEAADMATSDGHEELYQHIRMTEDDVYLLAEEAEAAELNDDEEGDE